MSKFKISNVKVTNIRGTQKKDGVALLQCSGASPCKGIKIRDINVKLSNGKKISGYLCDYVEKISGFKCTGPTCQKPSGQGTC